MGKQHLRGGRGGLNYDNVVVIKTPDARVLHVVSRSLLLAMVLVALPLMESIMKGSVVSGFDAIATASGSISAEVLSLILRDMGEEGLLKREDKVLIMGPLRVMDSDESYDFVFTRSFDDAVFADTILRINGIVVFPLSTDPSNADFIKRSNYRVVYVKRYVATVVALRKIELVNNFVDSSPKGKLCQLASQVKKSALKGLEDVLFEPPRKDFAKPNKMKYLPELLDDSLEGYKRRVFIGVGLAEENRAAIEWFEQNYPKKGAKFQIHSLLVVPEDVGVPPMNVSAWLAKHVKEEEYVVMKAEADEVLEMMKESTICLVDELFLECNNEWWYTGKRKKSGRPYWECLTLYGRLRDEGIAGSPEGKS
ncbi:hypothetical protein CR513_51312, partial [Mucuna pruriens]